MKAAYVTSQSLVQALIIRVHFKYNNPSLLPAAVSITRLEVEKSLTQEKTIMVSSTPALGYIIFPLLIFQSPEDICFGGHGQTLWVRIDKP